MATFFGLLSAGIAVALKDVIASFAEHNDIDLAYPTQRFYDNLAEGKPGTKPAYYTQNVNASDHDRQGTDRP